MISIAPTDASMMTAPSVVVPAAPEQSPRTERPSDIPPPETTKAPATSTKRGSYNYDREHGYPLEWSDFAAFNAWRREEELQDSIELIASTVKRGGPLWTEKRLYVCSRQPSGGRREVEKKNPDWRRKIGSKKTGCRCRVVIKLYPHTDAILGNYTNTHDHEVGSENIAYMRMSHAAREQIKSMLVQKVDHKEIIRAVHDAAPAGSRDKFIVLADVNRMGRAVEQAKKSERVSPAEDSELTAQSIGVVKGKRRRIHNDPYTGGERSGKRTKPDATTSTANAPPPHR